MAIPSQPISSEALSDLILSIYDCSIAPDRWNDTLGLICQATQCACAAITMNEFDGSSTVIFRHHGISTVWTDAFKPEYAADAANFFRSVLARPDFDVNEPLVLSRLFTPEMIDNLPVHRDWARPQGLCDVMSGLILHTGERVASVDLMRHERDGPVRDENIAVLRLLTPHLRRAITISDLLDLRTLAVTSMRSSLDGMAHGIIVVDRNSRILEANAAAKTMFGERSTIENRQGILSGVDAATRQDLRELIAHAGQTGAQTDKHSSGLALSVGDGQPPTIAHILPLTGGTVRPQLVTGAAAAIFVTSDRLRAQGAIAAIAGVYGLTQSEQRFLAHVADGTDVTTAAQALGITINTARTHMRRIFAKTGVGRHAELVALITRMTPPTV